jgi:hypothetical protein
LASMTESRMPVDVAVQSFTLVIMAQLESKWHKRPPDNWRAYSRCALAKTVSAAAHSKRLSSPRLLTRILFEPVN